MPEIMIARRPGVVYLNGQRRMVRRGRTTAHATHPIVTEHPKLWEPLKVDYPHTGGDPGQVETTTMEDPEPTFLHPEGRVDNAAVRAWAAANNIDVSPRGKPSQAVVDLYLAACGGR